MKTQKTLPAGIATVLKRLPYPVDKALMCVR
ncbi:Transposase [Mycetohabitans rhizoxinica HKI 454]|uniref:Transposase n=1 Tax=Mycetohabitans rhizoxinica (strain DSM 19002 / CIP 109453 / HKI 454) TaxID=882378 RepID=E5ANE0_MYCRK|nr:Transposase [Mycetohabitans rhizoxinica HKI 454]